MNIKDYIKIDDFWVWLIRVKITPNSPKNELFNILEDWTLKIRIKSIPEKGKANKELIKFLSKELDTLKENIDIVAWASDQLKIIKIKF